MSISNFHNKTLAVDVLIIGSGLAGMLSALELLKIGASVALVSKGELLESNTFYAQGGLAATLSGNVRTIFGDSLTTHLEDTVKAGQGLVDVNAARKLIGSGADLIEKLTAYGVNFDRTRDGSYELALEGGHRFPRVLHNQDATGRSVANALRSALQAVDHDLMIFPNSFCLSLINYEQVCLGAYVETEQERIRILAQQTVLATGGLGQIFSRTTNPSIATGDGLALAYRAGATLADLEFVQFHPTALALNGAPPYLISEAVRGAGAKLLNADGESFMSRFHPDGELATRDVVAKAISTTIQEQGGMPVYLDLRGIGGAVLRSHFPNILGICATYGIDITRQPIPVSPAAHYSMGGIAASTSGHTSLERLHAIGECAATGLHGANRLASNSLLEAGAMALQLVERLSKTRFMRVTNMVESNVRAKALSPLAVPDYPIQLASSMYQKVGLVRSKQSLQEALSHLRERTRPALPTNRHMFEKANLALVSELIVRSALLREESRGSHFRSDYPDTNDAGFGRRLFLSARGFSWLPTSGSLVGSSEAGIQNMVGKLRPV